MHSIGQTIIQTR